MKSQDPELAQAARIAIKDSLKVAKDEKVMIITNPGSEVYAVSLALYEASLEAGAHPTILVQEAKGQMDFAEEAVIAAFEAQPDVVISLSEEKLGKDRSGMETPYEWDGVNYDHVFHYQLRGARTLRAFWSPGITVELFKRTVPIDYRQLQERCARLKAVLEASVSVRVSNPKGTAVSLGVVGRQARMDDGNFAAPGSGGNLPAGEVFVSPALGSTEGTIVFDGSIANARGDIIIREAIHCVVKGGYVTSITGGEEARLLEATLDEAAARARAMGEDGSLPRDKAGAYARNARSIGELGLGLNPKAEIVGNMLVDEKAFRTCHFAIGANYDEDAPALIHLDGLVTEPTIVAVSASGQETLIEKDGVFLL